MIAAHKKRRTDVAIAANCMTGMIVSHTRFLSYKYKSIIILDGYADGVTRLELFDLIRSGDRVTIVDRFGQRRTGVATLRNRKDDLWVLNMGGSHGTPAIVSRDNVVKVTTPKKQQQKEDT